MKFDINFNNERAYFKYQGRNFELRRTLEIDSGIEIIVRYEIFVNGRELDLSELLNGDDGEELYEYLLLPYSGDGLPLEIENLPKEKLLDFIHRIVDRYHHHPHKITLFLRK